MFEKLLSVFLHAKGSAVATVLVLGASGALVTATVENGASTITFNQASPSPTAATGTQTGTQNAPFVSPATLVSNNSTPGATPNPNSCADEAHAINEQVKRVNDEFDRQHQAVEKMRKDARTDEARKLLATTDKNLKEIRQAAVKAIHETRTCAKENDEDKDEHEDEDNDEDANSANGDHDSNSSKKTSTGPSVAFSGTDPKAIAELAISAMKLQVENAKKELAKLPTPTPKNTRKPENVTRDSDKEKGEHKEGNKGHE